MAQLVRRKYGNVWMEFVECPHERAVYPIFPVVGLIRLSLRAVNHLACQNRGLSRCLRFRRLAQPKPEVMVCNKDDTAAKFIFQAAAFHHIFLIICRMIGNQSLVDGDTLRFLVDVLPAEPQQLAAGDPGFQEQHERQPVFPFLRKGIGGVILLLGIGVLHRPDLTLGPLDENGLP